MFHGRCPKLSAVSFRDMTYDWPGTPKLEDLTYRSIERHPGLENMCVSKFCADAGVKRIEQSQGLAESSDEKAVVSLHVAKSPSFLMLAQACFLL